jgi:glycerophosphoryl diester phosphodiesterase
MAVHIWTVDSLPRARCLAALGVDSIMTNRPGWLKTHLAGHEPC